MDRATLDALGAPFPASTVKSRRGPGGRTLDYVEGAEVVRRLNEALDGEWTFRVLERSIQTIHQRDGSERADLVIHGVLDIAGVQHEAFGGATLGYGENTADDWKMAYTDALKKAASYFGVGLHLWLDDADPPSPDRERKEVPLTDKQASALWAIAQKLAWDGAELERYVHERFGCGPRQLSKAQASGIIAELSTKAF